MYAITVSEFGGPEVLKYVEVTKPLVKPNHLLIKVEATSVNFADIKARYGNKDRQPPFIPGLDVAGTVVEVGEGGEGFQVGQRVIAFPQGGSYAEYVVAHTNLTFEIPATVDFTTAAACPIVSFTSYKLLADVGRMTHGDTVLIHAAAGGIGTTAIQLAKLLGASTVIGTVSKEEKVATALEAGADFAINTSRENFVEKVLEITQEKGVDLILDSIGGRVTEQSLLCLAKYGRLVNFGNASGETATIQTTDLTASCRSILGFSFGTTRKHRPETVRDTAKKVFEFLENGSLKIVIGEKFPLEEAGKAHKLMEERGSTGKILLIPETSTIRY